MRKIIAILLALTMVAAIGAAAFADDVSELPREETLYFAGQQWGTVLSWNIIGTNQNNSMAIAGGASGYRTLMFETLFMYNFMNGEIIGRVSAKTDPVPRRLNISDFGVVGDGKTLNTAALQAAIDAVSGRDEQLEITEIR